MATGAGQEPRRPEPEQARGLKGIAFVSALRRPEASPIAARAASTWRDAANRAGPGGGSRSSHLWLAACGSVWQRRHFAGPVLVESICGGLSPLDACLARRRCSHPFGLRGRCLALMTTTCISQVLCPLLKHDFSASSMLGPLLARLWPSWTGLAAGLARCLRSEGSAKWRGLASIKGRSGDEGKVLHRSCRNENALCEWPCQFSLPPESHLARLKGRTIVTSRLLQSTFESPDGGRRKDGFGGCEGSAGRPGRRGRPGREG